MKEKFNSALADIQSVMGLEGKTAESLVAEIGARQIAVETIIGILRDIEGIAQQFEGNMGESTEQEDSDFVHYHGKQKED